MKVLVGVDLRVQGHGWLLERAARLAASVEGGVVDLVHITPQPNDELQALLDGLLTLLPEPVRGASTVTAGDPADELITLTASYDVLIVGPREPAALQRWLVGPMATRVLRRAACVVLVPRSDHAFPAQPRMLVGLDVNGVGLDDVLGFSERWATLLDGRIDGVYAAHANLPTIRNRELREAAIRNLRAQHAPDLERVVAALDRLPEPQRGKALLELGEPEDVLVTLSSDYDVVLVGNRGRTGISKLLMGDVANHVVRSAHCDVLVLPTDGQG